jgi:hypothetical protein
MGEGKKAKHKEGKQMVWVVSQDKGKLLNVQGFQADKANLSLNGVTGEAKSVTLATYGSDAELDRAMSRIVSDLQSPSVQGSMKVVQVK